MAVQLVVTTALAPPPSIYACGGIVARDCMRVRLGCLACLWPVLGMPGPHRRRNLTLQPLLPCCRYRGMAFGGGQVGAPSSCRCFAHLGVGGRAGKPGKSSCMFSCLRYAREARMCAEPILVVFEGLLAPASIAIMP